jgi:2-oxoglutarate ferredoxin oxidoreductase subunit delta
MESREVKENEAGAESANAISGDAPSAETDKLHGKKHYEIDIFRGWCKSCGICAAFCPRDCLSLDSNGAPVIVDSNRCTGCAWCEMHCPDFAISVREKNCTKDKSEEA